MIRGRAPHAVLLVGPAGIGKTTLARDLAAGLLCTAEDIAARPCGSCRACRLVAAGHHPDVHRLGPEGPGRQVVIGGPGRPRGVRDLLADLALLPVEGGARVAIIEAASRMNDDAQAALLKTLEEPPAGVTLILCADTEESLLPTIRSRCARLRLGPVGVREIEAILAELGVAEPPQAGRLARIADGRPGVAIAWAADPEAMRTRDELARVLLDQLDARPAERLAAVRSAAARAMTLASVGDRPSDVDAGPAAANPPPTAGRGRRARPANATVTPAPETPTGSDRAEDAEGVAAEGDPGDAGDAAGLVPVRTPAAERRRAAEALVALWTDVARDLLLAGNGAGASVRDLGLLDETIAAASTLEPADLLAFLDRLGRAGVLVAGNVSPELVLDDLALAWPRPRAAAA
jgi:DNA polymerase-3 subunit delta'